MVESELSGGLHEERKKQSLSNNLIQRAKEHVPAARLDFHDRCTRGPNRKERVKARAGFQDKRASDQKVRNHFTSLSAHKANNADCTQDMRALV
jgi:hypothetical protein